jgi:hypothetical protein
MDGPDDRGAVPTAAAAAADGWVAGDQRPVARAAKEADEARRVGQPASKAGTAPAGRRLASPIASPPEAVLVA